MKYYSGNIALLEDKVIFDFKALCGEFLSVMSQCEVAGNIEPITAQKLDLQKRYFKLKERL